MQKIEIKSFAQDVNGNRSSKRLAGYISLACLVLILLSVCACSIFGVIIKNASIIDNAIYSLSSITIACLCATVFERKNKNDK